MHLDNRALILVGCSGLIAGLVLARFITDFPLELALIAATIGWILMRKGLKLLIVLFVATLWIGCWRGQAALGDLSKYDRYIEQQVTVIGRVIDDPSYDDRGQTQFHIGSPQINNEQLIGRVRVRSFGTGNINRGDIVSSEGKLYPGFGSWQGSVSFAETEVLEESNSQLERLRTEAITKTYTILPEPHASLGLGFLVGIKSFLPANLEENLAVVGLTHIVVASGYNLTILVRVSQRTVGRFSHRLALFGSIALIIAFLGITGLSPSIVRASAVSGVALAAAYFGRAVSPLVVIMLPAAVTATISPLYLWSDLGWWLSFLAFSGILIVAPLLTDRFYKKRTPGLLPSVLIETFSAQIMALPLIMVIFGELSVISFLANALVVPLVPLAMLMTTIALIGSFASPLLSLPATLVLGLIIKIVDLLAVIPGALVEVTMTWYQLGVIYCLVGAFALALHYHRKLYLKRQ